MRGCLSKAQGDSSPEQRAVRFNHLVLRGELRRAVRYILDREQGGVLDIDGTDEKSGRCGSCGSSGQTSG
eukprot:scaffold4214_cov102-Cylindrotheca_fusiformis.AAC.2